MKKKNRLTIALLLMIGYPAFLIWIGYRPFQRNIIDPGYEYYDVKSILADDPAFSDPYVNTANWSEELQGQKGLWWLKANIRIKEKKTPFEKYGISIMLKGSYDLYFDGILIGQNGVIDSSGKEVKAGLYRQTFMIPDSLVPNSGFYPIALRIANQQASSGQLPYIHTGEYLTLGRRPMALALFLHIAAGIFLIAGCYFGGLYLIYYREPEWLILAGLCLTFFGLTILEYMKYYVDYIHTWQYHRLVAIQGLTFWVSFMLPLYYLFHFKLPKKWSIMGAHLMVLLIIQLLFSGFDIPAYYMVLAAFVTSLYIITYAWIFSKRNSLAALFTILFFSVCLIIYFDFMLFVGFTSIVAFGLLALNQHTKTQKRLYEASLLKASRLEIELLKKKIQPHFLMNTLTSLINMVEEEPQVGIKMIHSLARMFQVLNEVSSQSQIPVQQEIELCKIHLEMMEYQRGIKYELQVSPIPDNEYIPPAVFLTLIENGITHQKPLNGQMKFLIDFKQSEVEKIYEINVEGKHRLSKNKNQKGIGVQYIKTRLEEWKKGAWELKSVEEENHYCTQIILKNTHEYFNRRG